MMELSFCVFIQMQSRYKESWNKVRDGGYKLRLDAISFQSAKASGDILSDVSLRTNRQPLVPVQANMKYP